MIEVEYGLGCLRCCVEAANFTSVGFQFGVLRVRWHTESTGRLYIWEAKLAAEFQIQPCQFVNVVIVFAAAVPSPNPSVAVAAGAAADAASAAAAASATAAAVAAAAAAAAATATADTAAAGAVATAAAAAALQVPPHLLIWRRHCFKSIATRFFISLMIISKPPILKLSLKLEMSH